MTDKPGGPYDEWARLDVDLTGDSIVAEQILREAGFCVITRPLGLNFGLSLKLGSNVFYGLRSIKDMIENLKAQEDE